MFRNYLMTALRNLARNRLYAAISILGLAVGFAAAILIAQFVRTEYSYDRWIPDYQHIYKLTHVLEQAGQAPQPSDVTQAVLASQIKLALPGMAATARLMQDFPTVHSRPGDDGIVDQTFSWADPDIFQVLQLQSLAGDLRTALQQPDSVVITREVARKYLGRDLPIGAVLDVQMGTDHHPMRVTAVLKDPPPNTSLVTEIFASARSAYSPLSRQDAAPPNYGGVSTYTYVRLNPRQTADDLRRALVVAGQPEAALFATGRAKFSFHALPMAQIHMTAPGLTGIVVKPTGSRSTTRAIATVGLLIVLVASINFVTLMTARASRRAVEVGVRKVSGARRGDLIVQFMGEALIQAVLSMLIAVVLAALLLKPFSAFVQRTVSLDFVHDPALTGGLVAATIAIGLLGGIYPALVLSSFRPASVLKGGLIQTAGSAAARQALVVLQFAVLIGLILTTITIYQQTNYALNQGIGAHRELTVGVWTPCNNAFPEEVRHLPGVQSAACSSLNALNSPSAKNISNVETRDGRTTTFSLAPVDFGFFEVYGVKPLAGRLFQRDHVGDAMAPPPPAPPGAPVTPPPPLRGPPPPVVLNETAMRDLGFTTPAAAIGQPMRWGFGPNGVQPSEIIGVIPDIPAMVETATEPTFYFVPPHPGGMLSIRLTGKDMPGTVREIGRVWKATGNIRPIQLIFFAEIRRIQYLDIIIQGVTIAICAAGAVSIAALGLFALSAFTAERRTKEIGIRKVMGASTFDVVKLLMWQFTVPVLWATALALPAGFLLMQRWLHGFAYHIDLTVWPFALAAGTALLIAWFTVSFQSLTVARAKPVEALRYE
jgi:putative ABC transport system permease protein